MNALPESRDVSPLSAPAVEREQSLIARTRAAEPLEEIIYSKERVTKLLEQNKVLAAQKEQLEEVLKGILESKSWKLTAPLRGFGTLSRSVRPLLRFSTSAYTLKAGRNVEVTDGKSCRITGPTPYCLLEPIEGNFPGGWVLVRPKVRLANGHMFFALYYTTTNDFADQHRVFLPLADESTQEFLVRLPHGVKALRLDPFVSEGSFEIERFEIQEIGKLQVAQALFEKHLGSVLEHPGMAFNKIRKAFAIVREGGLHALRVRLFSNQFTNNYQEWVKKYDTLTERDRKEIRTHIEELKHRPLISVVMPTYNPPEKWLRLALDSVLGQLYPNWELCIADDASTEPHVKAVLQEYAVKDARIKVHFREKNGHISAASNDALSLVSGEFVSLLDHDDELTEHALYMVAAAINENPEAGLLYSDEDKLTGYGMRFNPYFKSSWNPDLLLCQNYVCHLSTFRASLVKEIGGFRCGVEGAQDWDLILRASERLTEKQIVHIPHVLYHWRVIEGSTAQSTSYKPYVLKAQATSVADHLKALDVAGAEVRILEDIAQLRVRFPVPKPQPLVSMIIPTRDRLELLKRCVDTILKKTDYEPIEIIIMDNGSVEPETLRYFEAIQQQYPATGTRAVRVVRDDSPFNFSRLNNVAAQHARGTLIGFLNNDLEVIDGGWLTEMVSHAVRKEIGAVGARLLFPNDLLQHGGIILGIGGVAGHNHKGRTRHDPGYFNRAILLQNLSAVTAACLIMRRDVFDEIRGFDEELSVAFNDVDLCLRIRKVGYRIVYTPYAELYHHESASRGYENTPEKFMRFEREIELMKKKWKRVLGEDPYYNPNLTLLSEDFAFSFPPRARKPWGARHRSKEQL